MNNVIKIGLDPWTRQQMREGLQEFVSLYERRPLADNEGGMRSPHMFLTWFALRNLKPKAIVESGVWYGQGTWLLEQACPDAQLHCIDINLKRIKYKSKRARYYDHDFSTIDWGHLPKKETVLFFDDHQNAYERVKTAKWFGFTHLFFEDNYPLSRGDFYSLKKAFMHSGAASVFAKSIESKIKKAIEVFFKIQILKHSHSPANYADAKYLKQNLDVYYELPPVFKIAKTRWGDSWDDRNYPTPDPILVSVEKEYQRIFLDEAVYYTWMCYVKLK